MEKYKLLKDLPNAKVGEIFELTNTGLGHSYEDGTINWFCLFNECELKKFDILNPEKGWFKKIEEKKFGGRAPKEGVMFYYITPTGAIIKREWEDGYICMAMFECGSAFWTKEEAEREVKCRKAWARLKDNGFRYVNWYGGSKVISYELNIPENKSFIPKQICNDLNLLFESEE